MSVSIHTKNYFLRDYLHASMVLTLQILFVLALIVLIILFVFKPRKPQPVFLPANYKDILHDYVRFYATLHEDDKKKFEDRLEKFLGSIKITGANAEVEDIDRVLIAAGAIVPVFFIPDWEYINLREVLLYPGNFNHDFDQHGSERNVSGMVGTGHMQHVMILNKWELRQGFLDANSPRNTAIHEFVHLIDKMDGTLDGVPEILLERKFIPRWKELMEQNSNAIRQGVSDIDHYGATSDIEFFSVVCEYFFEQPARFQQMHPELDEVLKSTFRV